MRNNVKTVVHIASLLKLLRSSGLNGLSGDDHSSKAAGFNTANSLVEDTSGTFVEGFPNLAIYLEGSNKQPVKSMSLCTGLP